ncbi:testis-expressed protein 26 [Archocentrus centrarchus]|uniref:testis-expressed protein 26 n=1 Tax=Archocentrus centrarchus TaxID=63155 RepID=UPI0011E9FB2E|nr:testis-expressed protein 26 [Archocentrus centrarchus]
MDLSTLKAAITEGAKAKQWSPMAAKGGKQWWDPYETSHKRLFVHQPSSAADIFLKPPSTSLIDSYSQSGPFGSSVYSKDFSWKPACKPECIRTGTASGQRRNNPHPSKSFMMWRLPRDAARSSEYISFPLKRLPSEGEIREALTAQYRSTYQCDFMGAPPEYNDTEKAAGRLAPLHDGHRVSLSTDTEMRASYRRPNQKPELLANPSHYSCKTGPNVACRGIVPAVVSRNLHVQQKGANVTTYDQFFGKRVNNMTSVIKSLMPQELQQLHRILPKKEQEALKAVVREDVCPNNEEKVDKLPETVRDSGLPEWSSSWPGPR